MASCVNYVEAKKIAEDAAKNNKDEYVYVKENARIHVYTKKLTADNSIWFFADCEIFNGKNFEVLSTMSGNTLEDLSSIIGISWHQLKK